MTDPSVSKEDEDIHKHDFALYCVGMFCQFIGLILCVMIIYFLPYFLMNVTYAVPDFMYELRYPLEGHLDKSTYMDLFFIFTPVFICTIFLLLVAKRITIRLEVQHLPLEHEKRKGVRITSLKWQTILLLVVAALFLFTTFQYVLITDFLKALGS